jgi:hypothetical protein
VNQIITPKDLPDTQNQIIKHHVRRIFSEFDGMPTDLALTILQAAVFHITYSHVESEEGRNLILESFPKLGKENFDLWDEQKRKEQVE